MHNWVKCRIIIEKQIKGVIFADSIVKQFAPGKGWKMPEGQNCPEKRTENYQEKKQTGEEKMLKNTGRMKRTIEEYLVLTVATLILVVGVYVFKFPNNFSFGGVTGIAVVLGAIMPTTPGNITFIILPQLF